MKKIFSKLFSAIVLFSSAISIGCSLEPHFDDSSNENSARVIHENGWEEFDVNDIDEAKKAAPNKKSSMAKVISFDGALTKLFKIGAKKLTADMESDSGIAFANLTEKAASGLLRFTDGLLDNYTFGFYKAFSEVLFPSESKPDPQIEKIQEGINKIQDSVDDIKNQLSNLNDDLKYEFDGQKVSNRMQEIERQKAAFEKMFNYLECANKDEKNIDMMTYYALKNYAVESFGSIDKMRQAIQNFFTDYYKGDAVATRTYGESYRLISEELFAWRYQSSDFIETLIAQELEFSTKLFIIAGIMLDPSDNINLLFDMMIQETMKNCVDADRLEKLVKMNITAGKNQDPAVFDEIIAILAKYWVIVPTYHWEGEELVFDNNAIDDVEKNRFELFECECKVAEQSWNNLQNAFSQYVATINAIQVPVDKENEITCNIRGVRCTFSQNISQFDYVQKLSKLAELSASEKNEAAWLKLYKTGCLPSEKVDGYVRMLTADDYAKILNFYKTHNLKITDSKICNIINEGKIEGRYKTDGENAQEINLYNIFRYDAGFNFQNVEVSTTKFACFNKKEAMGFIVENERTDYGIEGPWYWLAWDSGKGLDGLHFWNVKVPAVKVNSKTAESSNDLLLEDMAARKGDKAKINRIKYYDDSKVSSTKYLVPNIITTF